jgi:hypothetical protein
MKTVHVSSEAVAMASFASMEFGFIVLPYYFTDSAALVMDRVAAITDGYSFISVVDNIDWLVAHVFATDR